MFGKQRDIDDTDTLDSSAIDGFFGDEAAAEAVVEVHELQYRVQQVESQINSQFTSLATYAQIAQEQVEVARSEAKATTERSEQRLTSLIERERADRISSFTGVAPGGSAPDVTARLDALEHSVAQIRKGLDECLQRQKALADAIATMFECMPRNSTAAEPVAVAQYVEEAEVIEPEVFETAEVIAFAPLTLDSPTIDADRQSAPLNGPSPTCRSTAETALLPNSCRQSNDMTMASRSGIDRISGRFPCACRLRPTWDRSAFG